MSSQASISKTQMQLQYVERAYQLRMLGLILAALPVTVILHDLHVPMWQWLMLGAYVLIWPQVSYLAARRAQSPAKAEVNSILADAVSAGIWIAIIQFNAVPGMVILMELGMTLVSSGGWRLAARGLLFAMLGTLLGILLVGLHWVPATNMEVLIASIPLLVVYPLVVSGATYQLARRVRRQNQLLNQLSRTDGLTGLPNRHHWQQAMALEFQRYLRTHRSAILVMIDVDGFKPLNDTYGHTAGDHILGRLAEILRENSRNIDTPGRFGGDEFALVMPETDRDGARMLMERVRREVERETFGDHGTIRVSVSIGLAEVDTDMSDPVDWIKAADDALYLAKEQGRNRVCTAPFAGPRGGLAV